MRKVLQKEDKKKISAEVKRVFRVVRKLVGGPCSLKVSWYLSRSTTQIQVKRPPVIEIALMDIWLDWTARHGRGYWEKRIGHKLNKFNELVIFVLLHEFIHVYDFYKICGGKKAQLDIWLESYKELEHDVNPIEMGTDAYARALLTQYIQNKPLTIEEM